MKAAINEGELLLIISRHRRGSFVIWDKVVKDVEEVLTGFWGVGRINYLLPVKITASTRYVRTKGDLAKLFGVTRATLQRWEAGGLIELEKTYQPKLRHKGYDAKIVSEQIKRVMERQKKAADWRKIQRRKKMQQN